MSALLLPSWFNPWGWIGISVAVLLILIAIIVLIVVSGKKKAAKEREEDDAPAAATRAPAKQEATAEEEQKPVKKTETKTAAKTETKPAAKTENKTAAKPSVKTYHISKRKEDNRWQVKAAGGEKALKLFNTQAEAIEFAKKVAGNQEANIMVHKEDGSFRKLKY